LFTALSGAPGHQIQSDTGSYKTKILPIGRWDPAVAKVGGTWDQLLMKGERIWGAIASSDYHGDYRTSGFVNLPQFMLHRQQRTDKRNKSRYFFGLTMVSHLQAMILVYRLKTENESTLELLLSFLKT
jgi:hypothetical protein